VRSAEQAFWDKSAVVPLCIPQPRTALSYRLLRTHGRMVIWWATPVEAQSAFSRVLQAGETAGERLRLALARLAWLRQSWDEVAPSEQVRALAETLPQKYRLHAADAFQLAAALVWCRERPAAGHSSASTSDWPMPLRRRASQCSASHRLSGSAPVAWRPERAGAAVVTPGGLTALKYLTCRI
jgi:predicted nucleic acid-binding protein